MSNPFIIAEIGINHNGSLDIAKQLIKMANDAGADAVKFQKRTIELCYTPEYLASPRESPWGKTQGDQKRALEFGRSEYDQIDDYCHKIGIEWFASAWDLPSQHFLNLYNPRFNKIASPMITNLPLVTMVAKAKVHTFLSTGLGKGLGEAIAIFRKYNCQFTILHCVASKKKDILYYDRYLAFDKETHLAEIPRLKERYGVPVGFSCHNYSILAPIQAVVMGAEAIEVHITLDRASYGTDQPCSFEKGGLERIVRDSRRIKELME